jgi:diadenosine tetraphosphate (Ap4A) HIT family hydrolase
MTSAAPACELCAHEQTAAWSLVCRDERLRIVRVLDAPMFPAFYRVIWNEHVAEFSDLSPAERAHCLEAVVTVEQLLRDALAPTKINLAALGNLVPHLHWHVIARFEHDSHFPQPIWGQQQRTPEPPTAQRLAVPLAELDRRIHRAFTSA